MVGSVWFAKKALVAAVILLWMNWMASAMGVERMSVALPGLPVEEGWPLLTTGPGGAADEAPLDDSAGAVVMFRWLDVLVGRPLTFLVDFSGAVPSIARVCGGIGTSS